MGASSAQANWPWKTVVVGVVVPVVVVVVCDVVGVVVCDVVAVVVAVVVVAPSMSGEISVVVVVSGGGCGARCRACRR